MQIQYRYSMVVLAAFFMHAAALSFEPSGNHIRVGIYENPPKVFIDQNDQPAGLFIDILEAIAQKEGLTVEYFPGSWAGRLADLEAGIIDMVPDMAWSEERASIFRFMKIPVIDSWLQFFTLREKEINALSDLHGKTITLIQGSVQHEYLQHRFRETFNIDYTLKPVAGVLEAAKLLKTGQADVLLADRFFYFSNLDRTTIVPSSLILNPTSLYFVFRADAPDQWISSFEVALGELKNDPHSEFYDSLNLWFDLSYIDKTPPYKNRLLWISLLGIVLLVIIAVRLSSKLIWRSRELRFRSGILRSANKMLEELLEERRVNENKLKESEERFKSLFYKTAEPAALIKDYQFTDCNEALISYLGFEDESEIIGKTPWDLSPVEQPDGERSEIKARKLIGLTFQNRSTRFEWAHVASDGRILLAEVVLTLIAVGEENIVFVDIRDITESAKAKQELIQQKVFIQTVLDNLPVGVTISATNLDEVLYYNKKFSAIIDWPDEVLKDREKLFEKILPDEDFRKKFKSRIDADIKSGNLESMLWSAVKIHTRGHGTRHISIGAIPIPEQNIMVTTVQDISPAMLAEMEAKKERDKLRVILSIAKMIGKSVTFEDSLRLIVERICVETSWDMGEAWVPSEKEQAMVFSGAHYCSDEKLAGYIDLSKTYKFARGTGIPGRIWESNEALWIADVQNEDLFLRKKEARQFGLRTGVGFPVLANGNVVFVMVFFNKSKIEHDTWLVGLVSAISLQLGELFLRKTIETEKARTLEMLKESEQRLIQAQRIGQIGSWEYDPATDLVAATPQAYQIFGLEERGKLTMTRIMSTVLNEYRPVFRQSLQEHAETGKAFDVMFQIRRFKDGHIRYIHAIAQKSKEKGIMSGIIRDITETRINDRLKQEIIIANESARFKQNFLAQMSHEIRTPLTGIEGMIELLGKTNLDTTQADFLDTIQFSSESLKTIINEVLDYSRLEAGGLNLSPVTFSFTELFDRSFKLFQGINKSGFEFQCKGKEKLPELIHADKHRVLQVINNFVTNAVKYADPGVITLEILPLNAHNNNKQTFKVMVHDQGPGITAEKKAMLFKPFSQIHKNSDIVIEGTGLGLSICKELSILLGGEAGVDSEPGKGSSFWFTFRAGLVAGNKKSTEISSDSATKSTRTNVNRRLQVLLVDDIEVNRKVISLILASLGHLITLAFNGKQAVDAFKPGAFDLVLMDIQMPVMDGITATRKLREIYPDLPPIVGLSASAMHGDREKYMSMGLDDYITKPVRSDDFNQLITRLGL